jgi:maltooligosyltrehalose trehalohydrolase
MTARAGRLFGPLVLEDGVRFQLWAPDAESVELVLGERLLAMERGADGFAALTVAGVRPGDRYAFRVGGQVVADPASGWQADGVTGPSRIVDPALMGRNRRLGRAWRESVIAEVHTGTATREGTFRALIDKLDHYADAGFTTLQLMPIGAFPGRFNWGYDGVLPFAPAAAYGSPEDLVALVAAAHERGLMMMLDVVYNHFGPEGNFLNAYASRFFDPAAHTPWGVAIDTRNAAVRRFFVENALMWLEDYGFDGLRFDAVHAYHEEGTAAFFQGLAEAMAGLAPRPHLVAENEDNRADLLERDDEGAARVFDAQWNDDFHNSLHVALTGETEGYYAAYSDQPARLFARALSQGFVYQGEANPLKPGARRGQPCGHLPPDAFVSFAQNHDQVGNRPVGNRLVETLGADAAALARFVTMMSPQIPLIFMGEEFSARTRFPYFCDFGGELAEAVRAGRKREFSSFPGFSGVIPDPISPETFQSAKLDWGHKDTAEGAQALRAHKALVDRRRRFIMPLLGTRFLSAETAVQDQAIAVAWTFEGGRLVMALNLGSEPALLEAEPLMTGLRDDVRFAVTGAVQGDETGLLFGPYAAAAWILV